MGKRLNSGVVLPLLPLLPGVLYILQKSIRWELKKLLLRSVRLLHSFIHPQPQTLSWIKGARRSIRKQTELFWRGLEALLPTSRPKQNLSIKCLVLLLGSAFILSDCTSSFVHCIYLALVQKCRGFCGLIQRSCCIQKIDFLTHFVHAFIKH